LFSDAGNIVVKKRANLDPYTVKILCFLHANRAVLAGMFAEIPQLPAAFV